jgi:hypothetical protein
MEWAAFDITALGIGLDSPLLWLGFIVGCAAEIGVLILLRKVWRCRARR